MSEKEDRRGVKDHGFQTGKRGMKAGALTIRKWKRQNAHRHNGGASAVNKGVQYWIRMVDGKWYPTGVRAGKAVVVVSDRPLGKRPV